MAHCLLHSELYLSFWEKGVSAVQQQCADSVAIGPGAHSTGGNQGPSRPNRTSGHIDMRAAKPLSSITMSMKHHQHRESRGPGPNILM